MQIPRMNALIKTINLFVENRIKTTPRSQHLPLNICEEILLYEGGIQFNEYDSFF